jgi:hypothetical protein
MSEFRKKLEEKVTFRNEMFASWKKNKQAQ